MAKAKSKVIDKDRGAKKRVANIKKLEKPVTLTVGIHAQEGAAIEEGSGKTIAEIGSIHEFGEGNMPERSFIGAYEDENEERIMGQIRKALDAAAAGRIEINRGLGIIGEKAVDGIIARIRAHIPPALSKARIKQKRQNADTPLIDDGQLVSSITYKVES